MSLTHPIEAITEDEHAIRAALQDAQLPSLLPALAYLTGDLSILRPELRPDPSNLLEPQGGLTEDQQREARDLALEVLLRFRDSGSRPADPPDRATLTEIMEFAMTGLEAYVPLLEEELAVTGGDVRAPGWTKAELAPDTEFSVAIIGAGMSGLLAAHRMEQAGIPWVIYEKNADVGGTWLENTYPGCRVDVTNHLYSFSFAAKDDWPQHFSSQEVLLEYFRDFAEGFGLRKNIRFGVEVSSASFHDDEKRWTLVLSTEGGEERVEANAVLSAVGQLNRAKFPAIPGRDSFRGPSFHSAAWDSSVDLAGKKVAVIGNGASATQFVPIIAEQAGEVRIYQRTPNWLAPTEDYHLEVQSGLRWLLRHVPSYSQWYRFWLFCTFAEGLLPAVRVDPDWPDREHSVSEINAEFAALLSEYLTVQCPDRPDLHAKIVPTYPPGSKRMLRDNGVWVATLLRDNVELVTDPIQEITAAGLVTSEDTYDADVLIYGTGFKASEFLTPMQVTGRGGVDLNEQWKGDARAYLGVTVPNFPNFFFLYGPNTNIVVNGSIIFFSECEVTYILQCVRLLLETQSGALDVKADVHDAYNAKVDEGNRQMTWGVATVPTWYQNSHGRVAQNWPFSLLEYWEHTREVRSEDYQLI